jgi:hypothetical protein
MTVAGIDASVYKSHTTRAASTSFLVGKQFDIKDIIGAAGWTKEERFTAFIIGTLF